MAMSLAGAYMKSWNYDEVQLLYKGPVARAALHAADRSCSVNLLVSKSIEFHKAAPD